MHKQGVVVAIQLALSVTGVCLAFLVYAWVVAMPFRDLWPLVPTIICAALPFGILLTAALQRVLYKSSIRQVWGMRQALHAYLVASIAQTAVVLTGAAALRYDIPAPLLAIHILALVSLVLFVPLIAGSTDTPLDKKPKQLVLAPEIRLLIGRGIIIAGLAVANFFWFFKRSHLSPEYVVVGSPDHQQAMAVVFATLAVCLLAVTLQHRSAIHRASLRSRGSLTSKAMRRALAISLFCVANLLYNPWIAPHFYLVPLSWADLGYVLVAGMLYIALTEFHRHNKKHSRKAVLALHPHTAQTQVKRPNR